VKGLAFIGWIALGLALGFLCGVRFAVSYHPSGPQLIYGNGVPHSWCIPGSVYFDQNSNTAYVCSQQWPGGKAAQR
jgi:hypothetical protein